MNEAMTAFLEIVKTAAPYSIFWSLGIKAYRFIVAAMTGEDARL